MRGYSLVYLPVMKAWINLDHVTGVYDKDNSLVVYFTPVYPTGMSKSDYSTEIITEQLKATVTGSDCDHLRAALAQNTIATAPLGLSGGDS